MNDDNYPGYTLHQIAPYIGRIRRSLARDLVKSYSQKGDLVWDPFSGSGTIPLECRLLDRHVIAADINPYACTLTRAKLHAPSSERNCLSQLKFIAKELGSISRKRKNQVPKWVRRFYNFKTLMETKSLFENFVRKRQYFYIGCLLGILHHQRPGFLSYPSSHSVPYLRDRLFPRDKYPEAYEYRAPIPRLQEKIKRVLSSSAPPRTSLYKVLHKSALERYINDSTVDAVITSPPYMDTLDYARDNRLRLWFLGVKDYKIVKRNEIGKISTFEEDMLSVLITMSKVIKPGGVCVFVLGDVIRNNHKYDVPLIICELAKANVKQLYLAKKLTRNVPNNYRTIKSKRATKKETIIVFIRKKGR